MSFSENLREIIDFRGIQLKELATKTGISKNTIDNYLSGQKSLPNIENGVKIAQSLGVTVEYLVTGKNTGSNNMLSSLIQKDSTSKNILLQDKEIIELLQNLKHLKKSDFDAIKSIIKSLAKS